MKAAFFHDHRFGVDAAGAHYSNGALPYRALARYLAHFDEVVVVGRAQAAGPATPTLASGPGLTMDCVDAGRYLVTPRVRRHVRRVLDSVDAAIVRLPSRLGLLACEEAARAGRPWLVEVVGSARDALLHHGSVAGWLSARPFHWLHRRAIARAPFAIYVTQRFLQREYPCRGETAYASNVAIEAPRVDVLEARLSRIRGVRSERAELRAVSELGERPPHPIPLPPQQRGGRGGTGPARPSGKTTAPAGRAVPVLGLVGSLDVEYKGHDLALRAVARLAREGRPVRLRLLGNGDPARWKARAEALGVAGAVEFSGTLPAGAAVLDWMDGLDVLLAPSRAEGLPRALVEGMSRALPAVGARVGAIPELLAARWLHDPGDADRLAALVARLLDDPAAQEREARRNFETARDYAAPVLEARRAAFLARFRERVASSR